MAACTHLDEIRVDRPGSVAGCEECLKTPPRLPHAQDSDHHLASSVEPGEDWTWCFADEVAFVLEGDR